MKKLKCTSCGASIKQNQYDDYVICEYCGARYKLNEDINININIDEDIKNGFKFAFKLRNKIMKIMLIPFMIMFTMIFISVFNTNKKREQFNDEHNESKETIKENIKNQEKDIEVKQFNITFEVYKGNRGIFFVKVMLDEIITNNLSNENKIISVKYNDSETNDIDEIKNIKQSLNQEEYIVVFEYDNEGYINKAIIK